MQYVTKYAGGLALTVALAVTARFIGSFVPGGVIGASVIALLLGMLVNPYLKNGAVWKGGIGLTSKQGLRLAIIMMGATLSFAQVVQVGRYSLIVMCFTLVTAFLGGYLLGRAFGMDWKLSGLISAGTGICGGSAIAAIAPVIEAEDRDVAYAISATFLFDVLMVILFPIAGRMIGMGDMGFGLWTGTAVNDTSSVVAAGYAFSDAAGAYSVIVKLTRTLTIIPTVLVFSVIGSRAKARALGEDKVARNKVSITKIFPYFILLFLVMVALKSAGIIPQELAALMSTVSKFLMVMALGAIGLKTNFKEMARSGALPMVHGFVISLAVVVASFGAQLLLGQVWA